jgi:osmoprotectant transport system substrate-binding protein
MRRQVAFGLVAAALVLTAAGHTGAGNAPGGKPTVRVGSTNFTEQVIVAELYGQILEANGYRVERRLNLGSREIVAPAIESGQIDLYPEYLATYLVYLTKDKNSASSDAAATHRSLQKVLVGKHLTVLDFAPAVDTNGLVVTKETAEKHKLRRVSDLAPLGKQLVLGGPPECPQRPFCLPGLQATYGVRFKDFKALDVGGPLTVAALEGKQIDVAVLFTTDAVIAVKGLVLLEDDKRLQLADNIAPVVRTPFLKDAPADFPVLINGISAQLTTEEVTGLNRRVGVEKRDPKQVAGAWLKQKGLLK